MYKIKYLFRLKQKVMELKTFKKKSFWGHYSRIVLGQYPSNICKFRGDVFLSLITLPLWIIPKTLISSFIEIFYNNFEHPSYMIDILISVMSFIFGMAILIGFSLVNIIYANSIWSGIFVSIFFGFVFIALGFLVIAGLIFGIQCLFKLFSFITTPNKVKESQSIIKESYRSLKNKICFEIYWK